MIITDTNRTRSLHELGYVVWKDLLDPSVDLLPLFEEYEALIDEVSTRLHADGAIPDRYADLPLGQRVVRLAVETRGEIFRYTDICLPGARTTGDTPIHLGPAVFGLLANQKLLDAVETFIGPEILVHPVQHARMKPPQHLVPNELFFNTMISRTVWHQDQSVVHEAGDGTNILTVWIPLTVADLETGCLLVVPGSHREDLILHCLETQKTKGLHIPEERLPPGAIPPRDGTGRCPVPPPADRALVPAEHERRPALEFRPALFAGGATHRQGLGAQLRGPQPGHPGIRRQRSSHLAGSVAGDPSPYLS